MVYHRIMQDVLSRSKSEFAAEHVPESTLSRLATLWESKLLGDSRVDVDPQDTGSTVLEHLTVKTHKSKETRSSKSKRKRCVGEEPVAEDSVEISKTHAQDEPEDLRKLENELVLSSDSDEDFQDIMKLNTPDILLGQFEKVSHTKSKWKCSLKDGIFSVNGRDVAFSRAIGEFLWS